MKHRLILVFGLLLVTLSAALANGAERALRSVRRAGVDDITTLDPHKVGYPGETTVMSDLFVGLTTLNAAAEVIPGCAESWTISPDGKTYRFRLRNNLKWSDGFALTAADFEYSLRRALQPATAFPYAGRLYLIKNARAVARGEMPIEALGVKANGAREVIVTLEHPAPYLLELLATFGMPVPRNRIEKHGADWSKIGNLVNDGPFVVVEWVPNSRVRLRRNPNFYDNARMPVDEVLHIPVTQPASAIRQFQAGELDFVLVVPPEQVTFARQTFGAALKVEPGLGVELVAFNNKSGATRDVRVRQALSMAIDRDALAKNILGDASVAAYGYVARGTHNYPQPARAEFATWSSTQRVERARALMQAAGYGPGKPLSLRFAFAANDTNRRIALVLDSMWRRIGVQVQLLAKEQRAVLADVVSGDFDLVRTQWLSGHTDAMSFLERLDGEAAGTTMNPSWYRSTVFDRLVSAAENEVDTVKRAALLRQAEAAALADQPAAPLFYYVGRRLVAPRITGWTNNARGIYLSRYMSVAAK